MAERKCLQRLRRSRYTKGVGKETDSSLIDLVAAASPRIGGGLMSLIAILLGTADSRTAALLQAKA